MRKIKALPQKNDSEYRIDIRGRGGKITALRVLERERGGEWQPCGEEFTEEHGVHCRKFVKVAASVAKRAVPRFDLDDIIRKAEGSARKNARVAKKPSAIKATAGNGSSGSEASDW
jgi:hypothetical protein